MRAIDKLIRPSIAKVRPYQSARSAFTGSASIYLDANENPNNTGINRYPDPWQTALKGQLSKMKRIEKDRIFLGNGSDEVIDLLIRAFCEPGVNEVVIPQPTYGMYSVSASVNNVETRMVSLDENFDPDVEAILRSATPNTKLIFLCSPNNPTGNILSKGRIIQLLQGFDGLVVVDEAYIDFADDPGFVSYLGEYRNLFLLQTLSKAWGLAGIRVGVGLGDPEVISALNRIKPPYNISSLSQEAALKGLKNETQTKSSVRYILNERERMAKELAEINPVLKVYPSYANFLFVKMQNANKIYQYLLTRGIVVRNWSDVKGCEECLRITIGTENENNMLIDTLLENGRGAK